MSTLSSTSTRAEVIAALDDNASFTEDNSPTKAGAYITAYRIYCRLTPQRERHGGTEELELPVEQYQAIAKEAKALLASSRAGAGSGVTHLSFSDFRS